MAKLILLRHLKSQWNLENRFTGWVDVPLAQSDLKKAKTISKKIFRNKIDVIYSSPLFRNEDTVARILESKKKYPVFIHLDKGRMKRWGKFKELDKPRTRTSSVRGEDYFPVYISQSLNERYYGRLQGLNKKEIMKKYGNEKVHLWRRGFRNIPPGGESLQGTSRRAVPFYKKYIKKDLKKGKNVLIVASHNSLRALIKHIEKISDKDIIDIEVPYGGIIKYSFNKSSGFKKSCQK